VNRTAADTLLSAFSFTALGLRLIKRKLARENFLERFVIAIGAASIRVDFAVGEADALCLNVNRALLLAVLRTVGRVVGQAYCQESEQNDFRFHYKKARPVLESTLISQLSQKCGFQVILK
jgi:hypothetical protein